MTCTSVTLAFRAIPSNLFFQRSIAGTLGHAGALRVDPWEQAEPLANDLDPNLAGVVHTRRVERVDVYHVSFVQGFGVPGVVFAAIFEFWTGPSPPSLFLSLFSSLSRFRPVSMRALARSAVGRLLLVSGQICGESAAGAASYAPLRAALAGIDRQTPLPDHRTLPWSVEERWFGSHISRQGDANGKKNKKNKKKKGGGSGQRRKKKGPSGTAPSAGAAAREEGAREEEAREEGARERSGGESPPEALGSETVGRWFSGGSDDAPFSYVGPFSSAVRKVKKLSLFSCCVTISSVPVMMYLDPAVLVEGAAGTSMTARMSLAGSLSAFGVGTTGLLHWFVSPYVHSLTYGDGTLRVETLDLFARSRRTELALGDVDGGASDSMHPLSTFRDRRDGRVYYVDKEYFHHKELLDVLDPEKNEEGGAGEGWSD